MPLARVDCLDETTVTLFLDRRLRADRIADVETHIDGCPECRQLLSALARGRVSDGGTQPDTIDRYVLLRKLGAGGMGTVYAAYDPLLDREVALKLVPKGFLREAQAMAKISSPNVVAVFDVGVVGEQVFIAMELVAGTTLGAWLRAAPRGWREVVRVMEAAGRGLAAAHAAGLVHRDFKPDNVLIDGERVRVADFGLATRDGTAPHAVVGTPAYMAPEQLAHEPADAASDQFSFCVALYEALCGARPFAGETVTALAEAVRAGHVRPWTREQPGWLRALVVRGLAVEPAARHPSLAAVVAELARHRARRWPIVVGVAGLAAAGLVGWQLARGASGPSCAGFERELADIELGNLPPELARPLGEYARAWVAMRGEACAAHARGVQSDALLDRRMRCLDRRRDRFAALVHELTPATLAKGVYAAHALEPIVDCVAPDDDAAPADAAGRAQWVAWERALGSAANLWQLGRYADSERAAAGVVATAPKPVAAEAALVRAMAVEKQGDLARADRLYRDAALAAEAARRDRAAALARIGRVKVAVDRGRLDDAHEGLLAAAAATERAGAPAGLRRDLATQRAIVAASDGKYEEARAQFQGALDLAGEDPLVRAKCESNLAGSQLSLGHFAEAQRGHERALAARIAALGERHPDVATSRINLAQALTSQGQYRAAGEQLAAALAILETALGREHPRVATALLELAQVRLEEGKLDDALALDRRALAIQERIGPERQEVALVHNNIGDVLDELGRHEEAIAEYRTALALREKVLGPDHPDLGQSLNNMGNALIALKRYREALAAFERALAIKTRALGPDHFRLGPTLVGIGQVRLELGDSAHAIAPLARGCALLATGAPEDLATCQRLLARARAGR